MSKPETIGGSLHLEGLRLRLGAFRVEGLTLEVRAGEYFILLGPTGAGKTVLLETVAGLHVPQAGRVLLDGKDITRQPPEARRMGFVYQDYLLFPHWTVAENIAFGLALQRQPRWARALPWVGGRFRRQAARSEAVRRMMALLHIEHLAARKPAHLSGGERQRVALARALVVQPRVLLLDEPLSALDPQRREALRRELRRVQRALGVTVLHVTHDFEEAVALGDRIAVLHGGRVEQVGTPEAVFRRPATPFVAEFVGMRNIFLARAEPVGSGMARLSVGSVVMHAVTALQGEVHVAVRPEDVVLARQPLETSQRNVFRGRVESIEPRGALVYVAVAVEGGADGEPLRLVSAITSRALESLRLHLGDMVYVGFKASAVHVF